MSSWLFQNSTYHWLFLKLKLSFWRNHIVHLTVLKICYFDLKRLNSLEEQWENLYFRRIVTCKLLSIYWIFKVKINSNIIKYILTCIIIQSNFWRIQHFMNLKIIKFYKPFIHIHFIETLSIIRIKTNEYIKYLFCSILVIFAFISVKYLLRNG